MDAPWSPSRRRLLASHWSVVGLALLAGCAGDGGEGDPDTDGDVTTTAEARETTDATDPTEEDPTGKDPNTERTTEPDATASPGPGDLDLREANVVGVDVERQDAAYRFDVTLHHDDAGEDGYANWWQVERLDGTRLGRRELLHPHSLQPFTRSATIEVPDGVTCVVVRGHDQTHGYGGRAMTVDLESGATRAIDQGPEGQSLGSQDCP